MTCARCEQPHPLAMLLYCLYCQRAFCWSCFDLHPCRAAPEPIVG